MPHQDDHKMMYRDNRKTALMAASRIIAMVSPRRTTRALYPHDNIAERTVEMARIFEQYIEEGRIPSDDR